MGRPLRAARCATTAGRPSSGSSARFCAAGGAAHVDEIEDAEPRTSSATASAERCTLAGSNAGHETEGIFTRRARSAMVTGNPASTAVRKASIGGAAADADSVRRGSVMPVILRGTDSRNPVAKQPDSTTTEAKRRRRDSEARLKNGTKGAPTPSRAAQEAARKRPLVPDDRKEAAKQARAKAAESREKARVGMAMGEEKYLPMRDRGPQKKYVRDYIDARFSVGEVLIPVMFAVIVLTFIPSPEVQYIGILALWAFFGDRRHRRRRARLHPQQEARGQVRRRQGREGALVRRDACVAAASAAPAEAAGQARPVPLLKRSAGSGPGVHSRANERNRVSSSLSDPCCPIIDSAWRFGSRRS